MEFRSPRGVQLHYEDTGTGLPVLLLHAFPLSGSMFAAQRSALSQHARLIVPDLRGFGQSPVAEGTSTMEDLAEDALQLLDMLGISSAVVGGLSMGGYVALALLRRDPGRVRALVLADTQVGPDDGPAREAREVLAKDVLAQGTSVLVDRQLPRLVGAGASPAVRLRIEGMMRDANANAAAAAFRGMALRADSRDILARFSGPVLVLVGAEDRLTPPEKARAMASLSTNATLVEIPNAGHLSNLEAPDAFNAAVARFLDAQEAQP